MFEELHPFTEGNLPKDIIRLLNAKLKKLYGAELQDALMMELYQRMLKTYHSVFLSESFMWMENDMFFVLNKGCGIDGLSDVLREEFGSMDNLMRLESDPDRLWALMCDEDKRSILERSAYIRTFIQCT